MSGIKGTYGRGNPEKLDPYVSDYKVNLFEVAWLSDEQIAMFQSDFKVVADYFGRSERITAIHQQNQKLNMWKRYYNCFL